MNNKIKAQWMAQYLGQPVFQYCKGGQLVSVYPGLLRGIVDENHLLLRTVDMLTDDEMSVVCQLDYAKFWTDIYKQKLTERAELLIGNRCFNPAMSGYLRLIGILLPFIYLNESNQPETLTQAQLVEMGWAKIKTT